MIKRSTDFTRKSGSHKVVTGKDKLILITGPKLSGIPPNLGFGITVLSGEVGK